jgi:MFS family permease
MVVVSGLSATLLGGWLGDRLRDRWSGAYFLVSGWSTIIALPFFLLMLVLPFPWAWGAIFIAVFGLFVNTGPANTILANVTRSNIRATGFAFNILVIHMFGDAISPALIGFIADLTDLNTAFLIISGLILVGGTSWTLGARHLATDTANAERIES